MKKILFVTFILFAVLMPVLSPVFADIIPCTDDCGYEQFLQLINNIINFLIVIAVPISVGIIAWAGFLYMYSGVVDNKKFAREIIVKVVKGFVLMLCAWVIVKTILSVVLKEEYVNNVPIQINNSTRQ